MSEKKKYIAKTFQGLEGVLEQELKDLGIEEVVSLNRSVAFECTFEQMMLANISLRTALRIYQPFYEFELIDEAHLYKTLLTIDWEQYLSIDKTFAIESVVVSKQFVNSHFISLKSKDAIVDFFNNKYNDRPNVDVRWPNVRIQIYISSTNKCVLSIDTTGEPLYKRGYKKRQTEASINECLAAGMILMSDWRGQKDFYDYMCGSGTLTAEALMIASHFPCNLYREKWAFFEFEGFNKLIFNKLVKTLKDKIVAPEVDFYTNDVSKEVMDIAKMNIFDLKIPTSRVQFSRDDFFEVKPQSHGMMILNPPYNERLELNDEDNWYKDLGDMLKRHYNGFQVWVISSNKSAMRKIGLKPSQRIELVNAALPCEFCLYEMY